MKMIKIKTTRVALSTIRLGTLKDTICLPPFFFPVFLACSCYRLSKGYNQGFGSVTFKPADPDLLNTDSHENA